MLQLADIFRDAGGAFRKRHGNRMLPSHRKAMRAIEQCRTPAAGGHLYECDRCGKREYSYHSCRDRHCPKCHREQTNRWIAKQRQRLPACAYFLLTFTLPAQLRHLVRSHQKTAYRILFTSAARSLLKLATDPRYLGARPGALAVLHTWTRALVYHPHIHMLVTAGGVRYGQQGWIPPKRSRFLLPGYALSTIFHAKFKEGLRRAGLLSLAPPKVWDKDWVVHLKHAGNGERALEYLGRYVFRVALVNSRIEHYECGRVTFRYRDNRTQQTKRCTLEVHEFIARFLQHVLPTGFTKVRSYGLFAPSDAKNLKRARESLAVPQPAPPPSASQPRQQHDTLSIRVNGPAYPPPRRCTACSAGVMRLLKILPRQWRSPP